jgi:hypothetical protein
MPVITVSERLIQPAGHHRVPRTHATWIPIEDPDNPDQPPNHYEVGHHFQHQFPGHLPMPGGGGGQATFVFACASNTVTGATYPTSFVDADVTDTNPMTVIAYYAPPGGLGPNGGPGWFVDAFSVAHNDFVDDNPFVTVEGNAQATSDANIIGEVSTAGHALHLDAKPSISTGETFEEWVGTAATTDDVDVLAADSNGIAIATYHQTAPVTPPRGPDGSRYEQWIEIIAGIINDAPGWYIGPDGKPHPYDPGWGTFVQKAVQAVVVARQSQGMASHGQIAQAAVHDLGAAFKELSASVGHAAQPVERVAELDKTI